MIAQVKEIKESPLVLAQGQLMAAQENGPYKKYGSGDGIQSWGFILRDGSAKNAMGRPCCATLPGTIPGGTKPDAFYLWQETVITDDVRAWINWIVGEKSPWIELIKAQPEQDFEFILKYGFVMTNLEFPSNYIVTFMKAWRMTLEFPTRVAGWKKAVEKGAHPNVAAYLADIAMLQGDNTIALTFGSGHSWAQPYSAAVDGLTNLINQKYVRANASPHNFRDSRSYYPCDQVWGYSDHNDYSTHGRHAGKKNLYQLADEYSKTQCTSGPARRFGLSRGELKQNNMTVDQWAEFCNQMYKEATK